MSVATKGITSVFQPYEVIFDILSWVPVKSLCRFRCVSKEWFALISDPAFVALHKSRAEPLMVTKTFEKSSLQLVDMDGNVARVIDVGSTFWKIIRTSAEHELVCVITRDLRMQIIDVATGKVLGPGPGMERNTLGFGRAVPSGVHKIVSLRNDTCEVLTLGDHARWRRKLPPPVLTNISACRGTITVRGMLHIFVQEHDIMLCFDLESEEWQKGIKGPPRLEDNLYYIGLGELNGSLCVAMSDVCNYSGGCTTIWRLFDSEKSTWIKAYTIPSLGSSPYWEMMMPLRVLRDGRKLLFCGTPKMGSQEPLLQIYDPHTKTCTKSPKPPTDRLWNDISLCSLHLEHFVSAKI